MATFGVSNKTKKPFEVEQQPQQQSIPSSSDIRVSDTNQSVTTKSNPNTPQKIYNVNANGRNYPTTKQNFNPSKPTDPNNSQVIFGDKEHPNEVGISQKGSDQITWLSKESYAEENSRRTPGNSLINQQERAGVADQLTPEELAASQTIGQATPEELAAINKAPESIGIQALGESIAQGQGSQPFNAEMQQRTLNPGIAGEVLPGVLSKSLAAGGATATAASLTVAGAPVAVPLGTAAAVTTAVGTIYPALKKEYEQETALSSGSYSDSITNIKAIITAVNRGKDKLTSIELYNQEINKIRLAEARLKRLEEKNWLSNARPKLNKIKAFWNGQKQKYDQALLEAINKPNPNYVPDIEVPTNEN